MATLQNLREDYLYEKLPEGIITLDEQSILRALVGGIQDRLEDIRSFAKKYEVLFSADGTDNTVVLVTFDTSYGKVVTRTLDIQDDTPNVEGVTLTEWAADQLGLDVSQITSCVFGTDLLRYVDTNTLQYLAATIGAVLYQTASQSGSEALNQQTILNSYFPRLKIKGTAMSFDILGKLIGFDDVRMTPLWGRLSPRRPNDIGADVNDQDFTETPAYYPQQKTGVAYDPHVFRDGPYYSWTGTVSADPSSTSYYTQTVNGFQPWIKVLITGSVVHPAIGDSIVLAGGSPHTKASADAGQGLIFQALGEGADFNGLQVTFDDWNSGTDRLVSITDRLSTVKYRTSYFDLALTLTDEHAIQQFGTTTAKPNTDLQANPILDEGRVAVSPYRPWRGGSGDVHATFQDFAWVSSGSVTPVTPRAQATTSAVMTQFKTDEIQAAGQEAVQIMDEVRAATRFARRSSVGFLNKDDVQYAGQIATTLMFEMTGTAAAEGIASRHPASDYTFTARMRNASTLAIPFSTVPGYTYYVSFSNSLLGPYVRISDYFVGAGQDETFFALIGSGSGFFLVKQFPTGSVSQTPLTTAPNGTVYTLDMSVPLATEIDPLSNGTIVRFSDGVTFNGTYNLDQHWYRFSSISGKTALAASGLKVDAYWAPTTTEVVRDDPTPLPNTQVFAAFGDQTYNSVSYQVGTLVASWNPEFLVLLGDLNYEATQDDYWTEEKPFLPWINDGKVVAITGNHDLDVNRGQAFYNWFKVDKTSPGSDKRYYDRRIGNVHFFAIDTGIRTSETMNYDNWYGQLSEPARWLKEALSASQAPWKIVMIHHNSYSSANSGSGDYDRLKWPFKDWGADIVMNGHVHAYEHCLVQHPTRGNNGLHVLTIGAGGRQLVHYTVGPGSWGTVFRYPLSTQQKLGGAARFTVTATTCQWEYFTVDGTLRETYTITKDGITQTYQVRPEDEVEVIGQFEVFDEFPWRRDLIGNGELVEINSRTPSVVPNALEMKVSDKVAVKDQTGADYTVYGINSTVSPIRLASEMNPVDGLYVPGQIPIAYKGDFIDLLGVVVKRTDTIGYFTDVEAYCEPGFKLYHAGLVQTVLVADPVGFFGPHHRNGLVGWMPLNEHPDDAVTVKEVARNLDVNVQMVSVSSADRAWSDERGWYLNLQESGTVSATVERDLSDEFTMSFWMRSTGTFADTRLVSYSPLFIDSSALGTAIEFRAMTDSGTEALVATGSLTAGEFNFVTMSKSAQGYTCGIGVLATPLVMLGTNTLEAYSAFNEQDNATLTLRSASSGTATVGFQDIRIWNRPKTEAELNRVRNHEPVPTICTYWPSSIEVAGSRDRYGMRVLDSGFVTPDVMPPSVRMNQFVRITRHDDQGRYHGENRFNEVGLGGGTPLPLSWQMGQQFYEMTSNGTVAFCTSMGGVPYNAHWQIPGDNTYIGLPFSGSTTDGIVGVGTAYPTGGVWPPAMDFNNPAREFIWLKGDDGHVYEVNLRSTTTSAQMVGTLVARERSDAELVLNGALKVVTASPHVQQSTWATTGTAWVTFDNGTFDHRQILVEADGTASWSYSYASKGVAVLTDGTGEVKVYHPQSYRFAEQPTGNVSILVSSGTELTCNYGGYVYQNYTGGTLATPPLYMYLTSRTVEDTTPYEHPSTLSAWGRWTDNTDAALYGNTLSPKQSALDSNGIMEFENTGDILPGHYRLTIESGCIGRVDEDFDGFSVRLTLDTVQIDQRLLVGFSGSDFRGVDVIEFDYDGNNTANWLLTVQYLNYLADTSRGTARNLVVYSYKLERISTELYKVSIGGGPAPTLELVQTGSYTGTNAGGWLAILNSYGTVVNVVHESQIYPSNDTVTSTVPLSSMLTSNTWQRREDHYVSGSGLSVLPDGAPVAMPTFGGVIVR
ncbi:MAG: metallophosphoesterase [Azonexus sp.]